MPLTETEKAMIRNDVADALAQLASVVYELAHAPAEDKLNAENLRRVARQLDAARDTVRAAIDRMTPR